MADERITVAIVDDESDIRTLLRLTFAFDDRFEVIGEGANGQEAIELAERLHPRLLILDRQMPVLDGLEALPIIRQRSPDTEVVLYTAAADEGTYQAAIGAGVADVLDKTVVTSDLIDRLSDRLVERWAGADADVEVRIGPVDAQPARVWIENTAQLLDALRDHPDVIDPPVTVEALDLFDRFLDRWRGLAANGDEFYWVARARAADVERIVQQWAAIDAMTDEQLAVLGWHWSPPEGEPFFNALTAGVLEAMERHAMTRHLAQRLSRQWPSSGT